MFKFRNFLVLFTLIVLISAAYIFFNDSISTNTLEEPPDTVELSDTPEMEWKYVS